MLLDYEDGPCIQKKYEVPFLISIVFSAKPGLLSFSLTRKGLFHLKINLYSGQADKSTTYKRTLSPQAAQSYSIRTCSLTLNISLNLCVQQHKEKTLGCS